jgi:hypothetical protein
MVRCAEQVTLKRENEKCIQNFIRETLRERYDFGALYIAGRIILKRILKNMASVYEMVSSASDWSPVISCCEQDNEF